MLQANHVHQGDCVKLLGQCEAPFAELVFADPPFNIGYEYDEYEDTVEHEHYVAWTESWIRACTRVLKPHGSFYIAIGDEYAAEVRYIARDAGLHLRNWIIWHYTFGQNMKRKFSRSHAHIFYLVKDAKNFTFNDRQIRVPSARHTEYSDKRADPWGRVPDDTWAEFPRVCGTFKERAGWHGCQMPESLLMRIVRASSNEGDLVLDPFAGSGTTLVAAAKLGRRFIGIDLSTEYVAQARKRLLQTSKRQNVKTPKPGRNGATKRQGDVEWPELHDESLCSMYRETNTRLDRLTDNSVAMECFTRLLNERLATNYTADELAQRMFFLEKRAQLPRLKNDRAFNPKKPNGKIAGSNGTARSRIRQGRASRNVGAGGRKRGGHTASEETSDVLFDER